MIAALTNHLWQSTLFVLAAALVAAALRKNGAHVRHRVWLIASLKFLVPFSLLMSVGSALPRIAPTPGAITAPSVPDLSVDVDRFAQPFTSDVFTSPALATAKAATNWTPMILAGIWACGFIVVALTRLRDWRRIRAAMRASAPASIAAPVPVRSSPGLLEPGVVGLFRPVLLVPVGIEHQLTAPQLEAVLAHELCHVQRRDNLTSAIHMVVEATFWFHPLVWWIGARLVDERERACDEHVLRACGEPQVYAESILSVCKLYVESPIACVSGVGGADLRKRVAAILVNRVGLRLNPARRIALVIAAVLALLLPLAAGMLIAPLRALAKVPASAFAQAMADSTAQTAASQKFDVVSVKPCDPKNPASGGQRSGGAGASVSPGRLVENCLTLFNMIQNAYIRFADGRGHDPWTIFDTPIEGGPDWIKHDAFVVEATAASATSQEIMRGPMLQALLEDRFHLKLHRQTREGPVYDLTVAASGSRLRPAQEGVCVPTDWTAFPVYGHPMPLGAGQHLCGITETRGDASGSQYKATWDDEAISLDELTKEFLLLDRPVVNKTGIVGLVSLHVTYAFDRTDPNDAMPGPPSSTLFNVRVATAVLRDLGLELKPSTGARDFIVIDHVERPTPNEPASAAVLPATPTTTALAPARSTGAARR